MWPWRPTTIPLNEDHPRLSYGTVRRAGALNPSTVTHWAWKTPGAAPSIRITGGDGAFTIVDEGCEVRVVLRGRWLICPSCERPCQYMLRRDGWYAVRHTWRTSPGVHRRRKLLRALAREPVLSLKASAIRYQLSRIDRAVLMRLSDAYRRADSADR